MPDVRSDPRSGRGALVEPPAVAPGVEAPSERRRARVEPSSPWWRLELRDLWRHRELLYFLIWRDVKVRYKQTALGAAWAILQPVVAMVVLTVAFGHFANVPSDGIPYPLFALAGLVPWTFFATGLAVGSTSVVGTPDLVTKVYFPRLIMPAAAVLAGVVDFVLAFLVLVVMMLSYGVWPGPRIVFLVPCLLLALVTTLGFALWFAALNVEYRDVRYALPFIVQVWLLATPVAYPSSLAGEPWHTLLGLNPMAGVVEGFRWSLLDAASAPGPLVAASAAVAVVVFATGAFYFRHLEDRFADII